MKEEKEQGRFEELIKAHLDNYEVDAPTHMWANIEAELSTGAAKKAFSLPRWAKYAAAAAIVAGAIATFSLLHTPTQTILPTVAINQEQPQPPTTPVVAVDDDGGDEPLAPTPSATPIQIIKQKTISKPLLAVAPSPETALTPTVEERVASYEEEETPILTKDRTESYAEQLAAFEEAGRQATAPAEQEPVRTKNSGKQFTLSLLAANNMASSNSQREEELLRNSASYNLASLDTDVEDVTYKHAIPISFGMKVATQLSPSWSLESGLVYSILSSDITANHQEGEQMLHYLGIPIHAIWEIATINKFQFYLTSGAQVDFDVYGSQRFDSYVENVSEQYYTDAEIEKTPQWSLHMRGGASYQLISRLALYVECGGAYYVDNNSSTVNVWKEQPLNFDLQLGLRTHF